MTNPTQHKADHVKNWSNKVNEILIIPVVAGSAEDENLLDCYMRGYTPDHAAATIQELRNRCYTRTVLIETNSDGMAHYSLGFEL